MAPTAAQIKAATEDLRSEAGVWDTESEEMGKIGPKAEGLRLTRVEAGLFQVIFGAYENVLNQVIARSGEGKTAMTEIGKTLRSVADTYDQEETDNVHKLKNLY